MSYKVLYFTKGQGTGFIGEFNQENNAYASAKVFVDAFPENWAHVFNDPTEFIPMKAQSEMKKAQKEQSK